MGNVVKRNIGNQVLVLLRKRIMLSHLKEGDRLIESALSKQLNVSRGPVREAIAKLEMEGLVKTPSNGRTVVQSFTIQDIKNLYNSRILLEVNALKNIKRELFEKERFYYFVQQMSDAHENGIRDVDSDLSYHLLLVKMTDDKTLIQLWTSLSGMIRTLIDVTTEYSMFNQGEIIEDHRMIIDYIASNEIDKAITVLERHLQEASDYYCQSVRKIMESEGQ